MTKRILSFALAWALALCLCLSVHAENPAVQTAFTPDPAPMVYDGVMYLYTGEDSTTDNGFYNMPNWHCYSTTDMVNWLDHGVIMYSEDFKWAEPASAWACQCIERGGKFYLYVTVTTDGGRAIGVAVSDSPTGPFKDALGKPLCGPDWLYIDPTVMIDDDGQAYLYFGNPNAYYCKLNEDMISLDGDVKMQEMTFDTFGPKPLGSDAPSSYTEGPWIYKRNGLYYLVYASNGVPEGISYSTSDSPTGPWKFRDIIMEPGDSTTIHPGIIDYKGRSYFFYHGVLLPNGGWNKRSTAIAEFEYNDDGTIPKITHDPAGVEQIENFDPFGHHEAETMSDSRGVWSVTSKKRIYIGEISDGDYIKLSGVNFADGAGSFSAEVFSTGGGKIELRLDGENGRKIGEIDVPEGGNFDKVSGALKENSGVHDLWFVFRAPKDSEIRFDSWEFYAGDAVPSGFPVWGIVPIAAAVVIAVLAAVIAANKRAHKS